jgi:hypothetical protein
MAGARCQNLSTCVLIRAKGGILVQAGEEAIKILFGIVFRVHPALVAVAKLAVLAPVLQSTFFAAVANEIALNALQGGLVPALAHRVATFNANGRGGLNVSHGGRRCARPRPWHTMEESEKRRGERKAEDGGERDNRRIESLAKGEEQPAVFFGCSSPVFV